jgi:glycosyltransferase involved in cell wall biosynthesis
LLYLKELHIPFIFEVYGDGSYREYAEKMGKVHGFVENIKPAIIEADIIFASSYLSMIQAFALKTPVFAAYTNVLKADYLHMTPFAQWIVAENDPKELAKKVVYFLKHKSELQEMVNLAYDWVKQQSWENVTNLYYNLWQK